MGLCEEEFWRLTPRKIGLLLERQKAKLRREETLLAVLRVDMINFSMRRPKEPLKLSDLIATEDLPKTERPKKLNRRHVASQIHSVMGALMRVTSAPAD